MNKKISKAIQYVIFLGLGVYLLYYVFTNPEIDLANVWQKIIAAKWKWVGVSMLASIVAHISRAMRWKLLLEGAGHKPKLLNVYNAMMAGYLTNTAIPRVGEFVRCGLVKKSDNVPFTSAFGTAMVERLVDMLMLLILVFSGLYFQYDIISGFFDEKIFTPLSSWVAEKATTRNLLILGGAVVAVIYFLFKSGNKIEKAVESKGKGSVDDIVDDIWEGLGSILKLKKMGQFIFHTLLIWTGYYFITYFCFFAFEATSSLGFMAGLAMIGVGSLAKSVPTPGHGMGAFHSIISYLLISYGIGLEDGVVLATVIHGSQTLFYIIFGAISYVWITFFTANNFIAEEKEETNEG